MARVCRDEVRKAKPQLKWKFVMCQKLQEFFKYYHGLDHDEVPCIHPTPVEQSNQEKNKTHGLR